MVVCCSGWRQRWWRGPALHRVTWAGYEFLKHRNPIFCQAKTFSVLLRTITQDTLRGGGREREGGFWINVLSVEFYYCTKAPTRNLSGGRDDVLSTEWCAYITHYILLFCSGSTDLRFAVNKNEYNLVAAQLVVFFIQEKLYTQNMPPFKEWGVRHWWKVYEKSKIKIKKVQYPVQNA